MLILSMFALLLIIITFLYLTHIRLLGYVRDEFDGGLLMSLLGAATVNVEEYGRSGQRVIHETYAGEGDGWDAPENADCPDTYLDVALLKAQKYLRENLNLSADGTSGKSVIDGRVVLEEFRVYNVYRDPDTEKSRIYEFIWRDGVWKKTEHAKGEAVYVSGAGDRGNKRTRVEDTTVYGKISFAVSVFPYLENMQGMRGRTVQVTMERSVSVPEN